MLTWDTTVLKIFDKIWPSVLTYADHVLADGVEVVDLFLLGGVDDNDRGAKDTEKAANLTVKVQLLIQQCGGENSTVGGVCVCVCGGGGEGAW